MTRARDYLERDEHVARVAAESALMRATERALSWLTWTWSESEAARLLRALRSWFTR